MKRKLLIIFISLLAVKGFTQSNNCNSAASSEISVGSSCNFTSWNSSNNTDFWDAAGTNGTCNEADLDDAWGWFYATSTSTTITYSPDSQDAILTLFEGSCDANGTPIACSDTGLAGDAETITYATTIGTRYRVRIQRWNSNGNMNGDICVYNAHDPCASITNIASCGTNITSNFSAGTGAVAGACTFLADGQENVYTFTPTVTGVYSIDQTSSTDYVDYYYKAVSAGCSSSGWTCTGAELDGAATGGSFNLTAGTQYYIMVDPEFTTGGSAVFNIACPVTSSYCSVTSNFNTDYIDDFSTNVGVGLDISNLNSGFTPPGYEDNSSTEIVEQFAGEIVEFTVDFSGTTDTFGFNVWVDWNNDFDFDDANEQVYASGAYITGVTDDFTIPGATASGNYRMRIRADFFDTDPDPCGTISYGEVEDYTLTVPAITCTDDPSNITVTAITTTTATISWTAPSPIPGIGYEYFVTTNASTPSYTQTPTGTTINTVTTANLTGLTENTTYYVWVRSVCSAGTGGKGNWIGPEPFTTLATPPTVTDVTICPGDPSQDLTATASCVSSSTTNSIAGNLDIAGPYADTPPWFIVSTDPCAFDPTYNKNYDTFDFQVDTDGVYVFEIDPTLPPDFMGYIVINDPLDPFTYGSCATGTWIAGDDDSGPGLDAAITATLSTGIDYTLVTTLALSASQSTPYNWTISGAGSLITGSSGTIEWYTSSSGGSPIGTGTSFDPVGVAGSGLANTNTPGVYNYWAACSASPTTRTEANFVIGKVWNGTPGNTDWATATNWIPNDAIPSASECVIIPNTGGNNPIIDNTTDALGYTLTIQSGATLTQNSNSTLTITNEVVVETGGTYNMLDSSSLIQIDNVVNTVDGSFTMIRNSADIRLQDYVYWSSPVTSFNIESISPATPANFLYEWNPSFDRGASPPPNPVPNDYGRWELAAGAMDVGSGYIVRGPTGYNISTTTPFSTTFNGIPNNGDILNVPISRGIYDGLPPYSATYIGPGSTQVTPSDDNWNLLGNPYPSAISGRQFVIDNTNIDGTLYLWTHATQLANNPTNDPFYDDFVYNYSDDYISHNLSGPLNPGDPGDLFIGAGQGFFVFMNDDPVDVTTNTTGTIFFNNNMRDATYANNVFYRNNSGNSESSSTERHRIWLDLISPNNIAKTTLLGYIEGATDGDDRLYDGYAFSSSETIIYSIVDEKEMSIQGKSLPFNENDIIPLGIVTDQQGSYSIAINTLDGLFGDETQDIFLEDMYLNTTHDLRTSPYNFNSNVGIFNDRFILRYTNNALGIDDNNILNGIKVFEEEHKIAVKSEYETIESVDVYDILGRVLFTDKAININRYSINSIKPSDITLFLKIKLNNGRQKVVKIIF